MKTEHVMRYEAFFEDNPVLRRLLLEKPTLALRVLNTLNEVEHPLTRTNREPLPTARLDFLVQQAKRGCPCPSGDRTLQHASICLSV